MTLVAGIVFVVTRRLLALSPTLALKYPIKKWAAVVAMAGSLLYDVATGSRVGTERALIMTLIVLGAVIKDRRALTMRNLAFAVLAVVAIEPDAILACRSSSRSQPSPRWSRSWRRGSRPTTSIPIRSCRSEEGPRRGPLAAHLIDRPLALLFATAFATSATASFMAYHFHDLSPYVLIGNPLTLTVIEFFAVPGALIGAALYPLGLDGPVWLYVGAGIKFILWVARFIADAPGSTVHLRAFAPYALPFLALAVMSAAIWRTWTFRSERRSTRADRARRRGPRAALRRHRRAVRRLGFGGDADGALEIVGKRFNAFAAEQWLTADGDGRDPAQARAADAPCDRLGCVADLPEGESLSIVLDRLAFDEDCARAEVVVSALTAPQRWRATGARSRTVPGRLRLRPRATTGWSSRPRRLAWPPIPQIAGDPDADH